MAGMAPVMLKAHRDLRCDCIMCFLAATEEILVDRASRLPHDAIRRKLAVVHYAHMHVKEEWPVKSPLESTSGRSELPDVVGMVACSEPRRAERVHHHRALLLMNNETILCCVL